MQAASHQGICLKTYSRSGADKNSVTSRSLTVYIVYATTYRASVELDITQSIRHSNLGARLQDIKRTWSADEQAEVYNETLDLLLQSNPWMEQFDLKTDEAQSTFGHNRFCCGPFIWLISAAVIDHIRVLWRLALSPE